MQKQSGTVIKLKNFDTSIIGKKIFYYGKVISTNDIAKKIALEGMDEGTVVLADEQENGRGRLKRSWLSPRGCIALSVVLKPELAQLPYIVMVSSLAVIRAIKTVTDLDAVIKWPNDVLINNKKVCGILIENKFHSKKLHSTVVGIGINVNVEISKLDDIQTIATSLDLEAHTEISRLQLLKSLLENLEYYYLRLTNPKLVFKEWRSNLVTLGKQVQTSYGNIIETGLAESVKQDGTLVIRRIDGSTVDVNVGDVTLRV